MRTLCLLTIFFVSLCLMGQNSDSLKRKADSLNVLKEKHLASIEQINKQLDEIHLAIDKVDTSNIKIKKYKTNTETQLFDKPEVLGKELLKIPENTIITTTGKFDNYLKTTYNGKVGYVYYIYMEDFELNDRLMKEVKVDLIKMYGKDIGTKIFDHKIWLGMTKGMAMDSRGKPSSINTSVDANGVTEQWVYYNAYLYFENGKLTSWQTRE